MDQFYKFYFHSKKYPENYQTDFPLHYAIQEENDIRAIFRLLSTGTIDIEKKDEKGQTPLHITLFPDSIKNSGFKARIIELLLERGANPLTVDTEGQSFLSKCYRFKFIEILGASLRPTAKEKIKKAIENNLHIPFSHSEIGQLFFRLGPDGITALCTLLNVQYDSHLNLLSNQPFQQNDKFHSILKMRPFFQKLPIEIKALILTYAFPLEDSTGFSWLLTELASYKIKSIIKNQIHFYTRLFEVFHSIEQRPPHLSNLTETSNRQLQKFNHSF